MWSSVFCVLAVSFNLVVRIQAGDQLSLGLSAESKRDQMLATKVYLVVSICKCFSSQNFRTNFMFSITGTSILGSTDVIAYKGPGLIGFG